MLRSSCVSALHFQVVQFHLGVGSCAYILPQNIQLYCCVVPPVVAHLKKTQALGWNFEVYMPNKMKGKSSRRHRCCLCYCCRFTALLCYAAVVALLSSFEFALCSDCADSPQLYPWYQLQPTKYTYVKRRCWKNNAGCLLNTNLFPA